MTETTADRDNLEIIKARLMDGRQVEFENSVLGEGSEGVVYYETGHKYVLKFYKDDRATEEEEFRHRLTNIIYHYNPFNDESTREFWKDYFCWPEAIVVAPRLGVRIPAYSNRYYSDAGYEKRMGFFASEKGLAYLPEDERGDWRGAMMMALSMARSVRRLHSSGLAHSDLSYNNFLGDPVNGTAVMIDLDGLVVPGIHPPKVAGTPGLIAPEVLMRRDVPSIRTDVHALACLIYQVLLLRHPFRGPKKHVCESAEEYEWISMGPGALFIENPHDKSNRPEGLNPEYRVTGRYLSSLIESSMVTNLFKPDHRPTAADWERALAHTIDMLVPCSSRSCSKGWFVLENDNTTCPWCNSPIKHSSMPIMEFYKEQRGQKGTYKPEGTYLVAWNGQRIFEWHVYDNVWAGERARQDVKAYITERNGGYYLNSVDIKAVILKQGRSSRLLPGQSIRLEDGQQILLDESNNGRLALVRMLVK